MLEEHLEKLVTFVGVTDAGSIRKYALSKRLSQPGVSQRIAALERQVGLPLFNRSRSGIQLTKHGRSLYELGLKLVQQAQEVESELYRESQLDVEIRFGTYDSVAIYLMPLVINEMQKRLPHVRIKLHADRSAVILRQLNEGLLDIGLCMALNIGKRLQCAPLYEDRYGFYIQSGRVDSENLITVSDATDDSGKTLASYIRKYGLNGKHILDAPSFEVAKAMTLAGLGIGILPNRVVIQSLQVGLLKKVALRSDIPPNFGLHSFGLVQRKGAADTLEMRILKEVILDAHQLQSRRN